MLACARNDVAGRERPLFSARIRAPAAASLAAPVAASLRPSALGAALMALAAALLGARGPLVVGVAAGDLLAILRVEHGRFEIDARLLGQLVAELVLQDARLHFLDSAVLQLAELERPVRQADQAIHGEPQMLENALDLAVLAFAQAHGEPHVGALHAIDLRLDAAHIRRRR